MKWGQLRATFEDEDDGTLRDIYVLNTSVDDWRRVCEAVRRSPFVCSFSLGGEPAVWPDDVGALFADEREESALLAVSGHGVSFHCHFFAEGEIEFDCDAREITGQTVLDTVIDFMRLLVSASGKAAVLTPENARDFPILRVSPDGVIE